MNEQINSKEYWENRFSTNDWEEHSGSEQSSYFAEILVNMLPEWFVRRVNTEKLSITDMGCASGEAYPHLRQKFPYSDISGADFAPSAIDSAQAHYPNGNFYVADITMPKTILPSDVIVCSNVLEHFHEPHSILQNLFQRAKQYVVLLVPFREDFFVEEHLTVFDTPHVAIKEGDYSLVYAASKQCYSEYYNAEQLLLIYSRADQDRDAVKLSDLVEHICNKEHKATQTDWQSMNDQLYLANTELNTLKAQQYPQQITQQVEDALLSLKEQSETIRRLETSCQSTKQVLDDLNLMKKVKEAQEKLNVEKRLLEEQKANTSNSNREKLSKVFSGLSSANQALEVAGNGRGYKYVLLARKTQNQLRSGGRNAKKDLLKYYSNKIFRTKYAARDLSELNEFMHVRDILSQVKNELNTVASLGPIGNGSRSCQLKQTPRIYILASVPYYDVGGGQRSAQLAKIFCQLGYRVHYFYAFDSSESVQFSLELPTEQHASIDCLSVEEMFCDADPESMLIIEAPCVKFLPYIRAAKQYGVPIVYEHIDNWETSLGSLVYDPDTFQELLRSSNALVATSMELKKQLGKYTDSPVHYLPNAVNISLFEPDYAYTEPEDLVRGKQKTLLYFGSLWGEWFDWDIVRKTAQACPDSTFNMIGDDKSISAIKETLPPNVFFLGMKKQTDLPAYLAYSDYAILPFKNCEIGNYVSPLKIYEYIAMRKYVLATPLPDISGYPNTLCSDQAADWIAAIQGEKSVEDPRGFSNDNSWYARCSALVNLCGRALIDYEKYRQKISVIVLNHNNKSVIFRCVDSLLQYNAHYQYEIIVVDNSSIDGSFEMLQEQYGDRIVLLKNEKNGCSSGRNLGVKHATGSHYVFLDSDQWVVSDRWLDAALHVLEKKASIGAVSWGAGWFLPGTVTGPIVDYMPNRGIRPQELYRDTVSYLATSGLLISRDTFASLEGFDEAYDPTCFEDTDLSFQVLHLGYRIAYCPYIAVMHIPHQTTNSGSSKHTSLMRKNGDYFLRKWNQIDPKIYEKATSIDINE